MSISEQNPLPFLKAPPLVEAIFELRWDLQKDTEKNFLRDPSYPRMYGQLFEKLKGRFPVSEDLPSCQSPPEWTPFVPRHRLRSREEGYPLIQIGPGLLTCNASKEYEGEKFRAQVLECVQMVLDFFPQEAFFLNFIKAELRYINAVPYEPSSPKDPLAFLAQKLHTSIEIDSEIFQQSEVQNFATGVSLHLSYPLKRPMGEVAFGFNLGKVQEKPAFIYQTVVHSLGEMVPVDQESFDAWLVEAQQVAKRCFSVFCKGSLMQTFRGL